MLDSTLWGRYRFLLLLLLVFSLPLAAQQIESPAPGEKFKFLFGFDSRKTIINRESVGITGVRIGLKKHKYAFGVGGYDSRFLGILGRTVRKPFLLNEFEPARTVEADVDFRYLSAFGEYYLVKRSWILLSVNTQVGVGNVNIAYDLDGKSENSKRGKVLLEHSAELTVRPFPWLELTGGAGYRYLINGEQQVKEAFTAPIYTLGGWIYFGKLFGKKDKG